MTNQAEPAGRLGLAAVLELVPGYGSFRAFTSQPFPEGHTP